MAQNITLLGASYSDVPAVELPKTGGGTASFTDISDTTAEAEDVAQGKYFYTSNGVRTVGSSAGGAVTSVNGQTGDVVLDAEDVGAITGMTILSYGSSTWQDFLTAYNANRVVYCRASSNSNPATGSQTRLAFMAYVNNATSPTEVEFQYYRSVSSHTASQQGDQVFVYKLNSTGWSVTVREASVKVAAGTGMSMAYSNGTATLSANIADATTSASGLMSATDKSNLDTLMDDYSSALVALGVTS